MLRRHSLSVLVLALALGGGRLVSGAPDLIPAEALFSDRASDAIKSDRPDPTWYSDGIDGVTSHFFTAVV